MSMDFTEFVSSLQTMLIVYDAAGITRLNDILPRIIEYAEKRIYRELDLQATRTANTSTQTVAGTRSVPIPSTMLVIEGVSIITPAGAFPTTSGAQRIPLLRVSRPFIDTTWPNETSSQAPQPFQTYYAVYQEEEQTGGEGSAEVPNNIIIAPTPDGNYTVEYTGTFRPDPLSSTNPNTVLTDKFPDLFMQAALVYGFQWQENAEMAQAAEIQYQSLREGAAIEEGLKKSMGPDGGAVRPHPHAEGPVSAPRGQQQPTTG